jgi:hypothetical protein
LDGVSSAIASTTSNIVIEAMLNGVRNGTVSIEIAGVTRNINVIDGSVGAGWNSDCSLNKATFIEELPLLITSIAIAIFLRWVIQ